MTENQTYGSPTTKELKKKHSLRLVGGAEMGSQGREDPWQGGGWRTEVGNSWPSRQSHIFAQINQRNNWKQDRPCNPGFQHGKRKPPNFWL